MQSSGEIAPREGRTMSTVIASEAKQSRASCETLDCFVAPLLAMTLKLREIHGGSIRDSDHLAPLAGRGRAEGAGEGDSPRARSAETPPHPNPLPASGERE
jgi:peptide/nickel transport system ATP-binding protein